MYNPNSSIDTNQIWDSLGTFYQNLPDEDKKKIEAYWNALIDTAEYGFFNLFQANLSIYIKDAPGYIEHQGEQYDVIFIDKENKGRETVEYIKLHSPKNINGQYTGTQADPENIEGEFDATGAEYSFSYIVTSVNSRGETLPSTPVVVSANSNLSTSNFIDLTWNSVEGALSYKVYGRIGGEEKLIGTTTSTFFRDEGQSIQDVDYPIRNTAISRYVYYLNSDYKYLSIPSIKGKFTEDILLEGIDYEIKDFNKLEFYKLPNVSNPSSDIVLREIYLADKGVSLLPSIVNFYLPHMGKMDPSELIENGNYLPKIQDWESLDNFEKAKWRAKHLKELIFALVVYFRKPPTMENLYKMYSLLRDYPFSYEDGEVTDISPTTITIIGSNEYIYDINGLSTSLSVGDDVNKFDIIVDGIEFNDFIENPSVISNYKVTHGGIDSYKVSILPSVGSSSNLFINPLYRLGTYVSSPEMLNFISDDELAKQLVPFEGEKRFINQSKV